MSLQAQGILPAPPVLTPPAGWLGYLGIKSGGSQPGQVAGFLTPTQEMAPFYNAGNRRLLSNLTGSIAVSTNNFVASHTVPAGKVWVIDAILCGGFAAVGAVGSLYLYCVITDSIGNGIFQSKASPKFVTGEVAFSEPIIAPGSLPLVLLPGYHVGFTVVAAAAVTAFNVGTSIWGQEVSA